MLDKEQGNKPSAFGQRYSHHSCLLSKIHPHPTGTILDFLGKRVFVSGFPRGQLVQGYDEHLQVHGKLATLIV